jgi:electron transfer flavoprotein beta subunit
MLVRRCNRVRRASRTRLEFARVKIAVCVKQVPEATAAKRIDPSTMRLDRTGEGTLNAFDVHAVEEALRLKEATGDGEVVLVSVGPERALEALRKALAMGADRALLVSDEAAAGSDLVATTRILGAALARENADLILFGQQASDSDGAVLWAAVADALRAPLISQAAELTLANGSVRAKRQTEYGYDVLEAPLPAVVAVSDAINEPRYPSLKGIMGAKRKPQDTVSLADLGVDPGEVGEGGSRTRVLALGAPPARGESRKLEDDGNAAEQIVAFLAEKRVI